MKVLLLSAMLATMVVGCAGQQTCKEEDVPNEPATKQPTKIQYRGWIRIV